MYVFLALKKSFVIGVAFIIIICFFSLTLYSSNQGVSGVCIDEKHTELIEKILEIRNKAFLEKNINTIESLYNKNTKLGTWAYEHQVKKMKYLHQWADKQGITFCTIKSKIRIRYIKERSSGYLYNFIASTEYKYTYENDPETVNMFRIGTYHSMNLDEIEDGCLISKEWYTDPFADSLNLDNIKTEEFKQQILSFSPRDFATLNKKRLSAVEYADRYCGAAANEEYGYSYNKKYKDYNPLGGDCANFASQVLFEGGNFKKTYSWKYEKDGSKAWVNAQAFTDNILYSGRGSLIARGSYNKVFKESFKLLPGDFVAYEKKGKITHVSVVTGADSKGYSLVNCHNTDRYRVPWDLGWSNKNIRFWFVRMNY